MIKRKVRKAQKSKDASLKVKQISFSASVLFVHTTKLASSQALPALRARSHWVKQTAKRCLFMTSNFF